MNQRPNGVLMGKPVATTPQGLPLGFFVCVWIFGLCFCVSKEDVCIYHVRGRSHPHSEIRIKEKREGNGTGTQSVAHLLKRRSAAVTFRSGLGEQWTSGWSAPCAPHSASGGKGLPGRAWASASAIPGLGGVFSGAALTVAKQHPGAGRGNRSVRARVGFSNSGWLGVLPREWLRCPCQGALTSSTG